MTEKEKMLRKLSGAQFAMWEIHVFLDTHPTDTMALAALKKYEKKFKEILAEYEEKYGPLTAHNSIGNTGFDWVDDPWPWEGAGN